MLKIIVLLVNVVLLSSCFEAIKEYTSTDYKKVTPNTSGIAVEDRTDLTQTDVANNDNGSFESQSQTAGNFSDNTDVAEQTAIINLKNTGTKFILYFPYDGFEIDETATQEIIKHANFMRDNTQLRLRLEGHADERGTREYNLALGENRALSIKEVLGLYELSSRVEVISFGEEKPIAQTHDESAWQQNRRVEFVYE